MRVFISSTATLEEAIAFAEMIFTASGPIQLMTGHKSKGLEAPIVFHLDPWRVPGKKAVQIAEASGDTSQLEQEKNLEYVINTRAMEALYLINLDDMGA
jgi:ATP-dependent exoDNAse (exonuclease V) beta subunit